MSITVDCPNCFQKLKAPNDVVGKDGLEAHYDAFLRGVPGGERVVVDAQGRIIGFLDETGSIASDRFFGVGLLKTQEPARLLRKIQKLRDRRKSLPLYKEFIDSMVTDTAVRFFCFIADRDVADPVERFGTQWEAYAKLAEQLVVACVQGDELLAIHLE